MRTLLVTVHDDDTDRVTRQLCAELRALDLDRVELAGDGQMPPHTKGVDPATVSAIIIGLGSSRVLVQLGRVLQSAVDRSRDRRITVKYGDHSLEISGSTRHDNQRVIEKFFHDIGGEK